MLFQNTISSIPFKRWVREDKENNRLFWFSLIAATISFTWLKIRYPYPNFMPPDSYNYLEAALRNDFINIWPIGYSKFLQLIGHISHSHVLLVVIQYIFLQISLLYLLFSLRYLLSPSKWLFRALLTISILNPLLPHIANFIGSDCLFTSLSLIWCTQLFWVVYRPTMPLLLSHAVILLMAFMVRYNALYYPFISFLIITISTMPRNYKWGGLISITILLSAFIGRTQYEYQKKTGTIQYSAFGGWQLAANALYGYAHAIPDSVGSVPIEFQELHKIVNRHMDSLNHLLFRPDHEIGIYYLWDFNSPLRKYLEQQWWWKDTSRSFFQKWAGMAPSYGSYAQYLISKHPGLFVTKYLWPNLKRYYSPPSYFMGMYNFGNTSVEPIAVTWFGWKNNKLTINAPDSKIYVADAFGVISPVINLIFITGLLAFVALAGFRRCSAASKKINLCILVIWIVNTLFSVLSAPIELRYQIFPLIISLIWAIFFVAYILLSMKDDRVKNLQQHFKTEAAA